MSKINTITKKEATVNYTKKLRIVHFKDSSRDYAQVKIKCLSTGYNEVHFFSISFGESFAQDARNLYFSIKTAPIQKQRFVSGLSKNQYADMVEREDGQL